MNLRRIGRFALVVAAFSIGCGPSDAPNPFLSTEAGADVASNDGADAVDTATIEPDAADKSDDGGEGGVVWGGPCSDDATCDDGIACTVNECDKVAGRCRTTPQDDPCQNGRFCDGRERCDAQLGCVPGTPEACSDGQSCTIDQCVEATRSCAHIARDADGDGDPDARCGMGHDCDDNDPMVSSLLPEICGNGKDDNCDGQVDEADCQRPAHDTCLEPLLIDAAGTYALSTVAAELDYAGSCTPSTSSTSMPTLRDVVAAITVPAGPAKDVDVVAVAPSGHLAIALASVCGNPATEVACAAAAASSEGGLVGRVRARALAPGSYPLYAWSDVDTTVTLHVTFDDPVPKPTNETCGSALPLAASTDVTAELVDAASDLPSACSASAGDLVWSFDLQTTSDVHIRAATLDGYAEPSVSLRDSGCAVLADELTCSTQSSPNLFWRALPAGTYFIRLSATAATVATFRWEADAPTSPPADESCAGAPLLPPNRTEDVDLAAHVDDIKLDCVGGFVDAAYDVELGEVDDVLLVERISEADSGAVELALPACNAPTDALACGLGSTSPVRASLRGVAAGSYRAVVESELGNPVSVTAFVRPAVSPTLVAFADTCDDAFEIPADGGLFEGNTSNAEADYGAGCDSGGGSENGAPDQVLKLTLSERKRVVMDMSGSSYVTILDVRSACDGPELDLGCSVGYDKNRSYFDQTLDSGTYFIQIDGFDGDSGPWSLDVRVVAP